jgi:hypothetical protein
MAKLQYNPATMLDPLGALKQATNVGEPVASRREQLSAPAVTNYNAPLTEVPRGTDLEPENTSRAAPVSVAPAKPLAASAKTSRNTIYLYPEDTAKLRQLNAYAGATHGIRANDSMVIRAALSLVEQDVRFVHALNQAIQADRRRTK